MYVIIAVMCYLAFPQIDFSRTYHSDSSIYNKIFEQDKEPRKLTVVVGDRCPACDRQKPVIEELKKEGYSIQVIQKTEYKGKVKIKRIPTLIFATEKGRELTFTEGFKSRDYLLEYLKKPL